MTSSDLLQPLLGRRPTQAVNCQKHADRLQSASGTKDLADLGGPDPEALLEQELLTVTAAWRRQSMKYYEALEAAKPAFKKFHIDSTEAYTRMEFAPDLHAKLAAIPEVVKFWEARAKLREKYPPVADARSKLSKLRASQYGAFQAWWRDLKTATKATWYPIDYTQDGPKL